MSFPPRRRAQSLPLMLLLLALLCAPALASAPLQGSSQLLLVTTPTWDAPAGRLQAWQRDANGWKPHGEPFTVAVGRSGSAWGIGLHPRQADGPHKQEGDGRSPAGVFAIGEAFGYASRIGGSMPYQPMLESSYCMDVPDSPLYNRIVDAAAVGSEAVAGSSEPMRLDLHNDGDRRYREGFVIEHNPRAEPGKGSCIFAHLWRQAGEATAGCTAMEPTDMNALLGWLRPDAHPLFVLLPEAEYQRLREEWDLPSSP